MGNGLSRLCMGHDDKHMEEFNSNYVNNVTLSTSNATTANETTDSELCCSELSIETNVKDGPILNKIHNSQDDMVTVDGIVFHLVEENTGTDTPVIGNMVSMEHGNDTTPTTTVVNDDISHIESTLLIPIPVPVPTTAPGNVSSDMVLDIVTPLPDIQEIKDMKLEIDNIEPFDMGYISSSYSSGASTPIVRTGPISNQDANTQQIAEYKLSTINEMLKRRLHNPRNTSPYLSNDMNFPSPYTLPIPDPVTVPIPITEVLLKDTIVLDNKLNESKGLIVANKLQDETTLPEYPMEQQLQVVQTPIIALQKVDTWDLEQEKHSTSIKNESNILGEVPDKEALLENKLKKKIVPQQPIITLEKVDAWDLEQESVPTETNVTIPSKPEDNAVVTLPAMDAETQSAITLDKVDDLAMGLLNELLGLEGESDSDKAVSTDAVEDIDTNDNDNIMSMESDPLSSKTNINIVSNEDIIPFQIPLNQSFQSTLPLESASDVDIQESRPMITRQEATDDTLDMESEFEMDYSPIKRQSSPFESLEYLSKQTIECDLVATEAMNTDTVMSMNKNIEEDFVSVADTDTSNVSDNSDNPNTILNNDSTLTRMNTSINANATNATNDTNDINNSHNTDYATDANNSNPKLPSESQSLLVEIPDDLNLNEEYTYMDLKHDLKEAIRILDINRLKHIINAHHMDIEDIRFDVS